MYHYGIAHLIATTIVKGVIYSIIYKIVRQLSLPEDIILGVVVIAIAWLTMGRSVRRY
jgi:hypothetical protein